MFRYLIPHSVFSIIRPIGRVDGNFSSSVEKLILESTFYKFQRNILCWIAFTVCNIKDDPISHHCSKTHCDHKTKAREDETVEE